MKHDIVTIGNGTGQGVVLRALRKLTDLERVTAIVGVTDNGGHAGALRLELGIPSVGDIKTVIAALTGETVWGQLFRHRFSVGRLTGVSMGNLMLAALIDEGGSLYHAVRRLTQALEIGAHIVPVTDSSAQVVAEMLDGSDIVGEWETITRPNRDVPISGVHLDPPVLPRPEATRALENARWIIICPGTLWLGVGAILATQGLRDIIRSSKAMIIAISNALTQPGVTDNMTASDHLICLEKLLGRSVDYYLFHDKPLPPEIIDLYFSKGFFPLVDDLDPSDSRIVRCDLISQEFIQVTDRVHFDPRRGYPHAMRYDPARIAEALIRVANLTPMDEGFMPKPKEERWQVKDF